MPQHDTRTLPADTLGLDEAAALLRAGEPVAIPTETVYGLAAPAADGDAVARIYAAKGRPAFNPLIVHVADAGQAATLVDANERARALMAAHWPGPLTLVLPLRPGAPVASLVTAGLPTLAVRAPNHRVARALIAAAGPLAAPSANASGRLSPTRAEHVLASLGGRIALILDDGPTSAGLESTIVAVEGDMLRLLRSGALPAETLGDLAAAQAGIIAPGQLASHYAPRLPLFLDRSERPAHEGENDLFYIGFGPGRSDLSLSPTGDLVEAAARLFDALHAAEASGRAAIGVAPIPHHGLGRAINDRLARAAAPRE